MGMSLLLLDLGFPCERSSCNVREVERNGMPAKKKVLRLNMVGCLLSFSGSTVCKPDPTSAKVLARRTTRIRFLEHGSKATVKDNNDEAGRNAEGILPEGEGRFRYTKR